MKKLMALILAAALAFASSVVVFANEEAASGNVPFTGVAREFVGPGGQVMGQLPSFADNTALTTRIQNLVTDTFQNRGANNQLPAVYGNIVLFAFDVEESLTAAKVELTVLDLNFQPVVVATYYLNKANNTEITADAFAESLDAVAVISEEEAEEDVEEDVEETEDVEGAVEEVEEVTVEMVPLRATAEALGFVISWNAELAMVSVSNDEVEYHLAAGSLFAVDADGQEFELEAAPENIDGTLYVPLSFFTDVLLGAPAAQETVAVDDETVEEEEEVVEE